MAASFMGRAEDAVTKATRCKRTMQVDKGPQGSTQGLRALLDGMPVMAFLNWFKESFTTNNSSEEKT